MTKSCLLVSGGTAGHVLPSLEIAKSLIKQGFHVHWLGHGEKLEYQIHSENITYHRVLSRSPRSKVLWNIAYWKLLASDMKVIRNLLRTYKFQFTLVTGNFISILPGLLSRYYKVPLYIYEQNSIIGQANRLLSPFSKKIFWGMHPLRKLSKKEVYTSQPLRDEILTLKQDLDLYRPQSRRNKKTILIMGGSLGAGFFNSTLVEHLAAVKNIHAWQIIHCAGRSQHVSNVQKKYQICNLDPLVLGYTDDIHRLYEKADIIIARAGALSLSEIIFLGKRALIIPMPNSVSDHQRKNVYSCLNNDNIEYIEQDDLQPKHLEELLGVRNEYNVFSPQDKIAQLCMDA